MNIAASIVCHGSWNTRIFTPSWVSEKVFSMDEGESMEIGLNEQQLNLLYKWKGIILLMLDNRLELRSDNCSHESLSLMELFYQRLSELLPYTPVFGVGFNINLTLTHEEYAGTSICGLIERRNLDIYSNNSQTFSAEKDGAFRSFVIQMNADNVEIRANFHYSDPKKVPTVGTTFSIIEKELKHFLGYEFSLC